MIFKVLMTVLLVAMVASSAIGQVTIGDGTVVADLALADVYDADNGLISGSVTNPDFIVDLNPANWGSLDTSNSFVSAGTRSVIEVSWSEMDVRNISGDDIMIGEEGSEEGSMGGLYARLSDSTQALEVAAVAARSAQTTIGLLVDLDVGLGRTGVQSPDEALALARAIDSTTGVQLDGILVYPGHVWDPADQQKLALAAVATLLEETLDLWRRDGLEAGIVSGGSTPTAYQSHWVPQYTEIRPGTYLYNDMNTVHGGYCTLDDCAARIVCTVISDAVPGQVVIDAGSKTLTSDRCISASDSGHGYVVEYPQAKITYLSEEHGQVDVTACDRKPTIGKRLIVVPNHICPCVNLHNTVWWLEQNSHPEPMPIDARGRIT